ncbi:MAG: HTH domain-containing protein [Candidatus Omnitrophica bacterium]|nr:HTH domain-containing protein [Candidatus Omnitrophota bacterium]
MLDSINKVKEVIAKIGFTRKGEKAEQIELTEKQIKILEMIREKEKITNKDLRLMFKISRQAIVKELSKLIDARLINLVGKGRGAYYEGTS